MNKQIAVVNDVRGRVIMMKEEVARLPIDQLVVRPDRRFSSQSTSYTAKKSRRLSEVPTDAGLPEPVAAGSSTDAATLRSGAKIVAIARQLSGSTIAADDVGVALEPSSVVEQAFQHHC